jgi:hypothetical protein
VILDWSEITLARVHSCNFYTEKWGYYLEKGGTDLMGSIMSTSMNWDVDAMLGGTM